MAYERAKAGGQGAFQLDGQMIDAPVVMRARQILHEAVGVGAERRNASQAASPHRPD